MRKTIKYIHFFPYEKFTMAFINFINENYNVNEHYFIVFGKTKYITINLESLENVLYFESIKQMLKINLNSLINLKNTKKIFVHSIFPGTEIILLRYIKYIKKMNIIFWGGDIYDLKKTNLNLRNFVLRELRKIIVSYVPKLITLVPNDYKEISNIIHVKGTNKIGVYPMDKSQHLIIKNIDCKKHDNPYKILIGNSATSSNCHFEVFDLIKKYSNENIIIYCPLSYGDEEYKEKVIKRGIELFNDKFIPLTKYLNFKDYLQIIGECSVCIFNNDRQQAMGNINSAFHLKSKVYLKKNTTMWTEYITKKYVVYDVQEILHQSFNEFINVSNEVILQNKKNIEYYRSNEYCKKIWNDLL
ncbi:TDP-N-acetylfucosamine:lipid II N-acetylfucosaminyltransferase [Clostridium sp. C1]|uniref:TDP-N-acetylfucosamine:lipid II N-acetylfucosaminyltransferase n=1 Tax=Clostridium sp. C1 TaxID=1155388 RepID=UPI001BAB522C|nr:TDP-N-acetylfucosamine:lipid II N-acetylfucosaminyltransferase [Clostridium sp. C1]QUN12890.1 TDP-N-acetylfucosamine:lipid II N-acetylfucosaminyltransferase [Clostridium sp. C1]